jgi:hypothetical protein
MAISQSIKSGSAGYAQSLVFRGQWLKQLKLATKNSRSTEVVDIDAEKSDRFRREPASTHEAALWLSYMASDFRTELARLQVDLGNLHRPKIEAVADTLNLHLSDAQTALSGYSSRQSRLEKLADAADGIRKTIDSLQTNLPVWNLARGLQLFLQDCKALRTAVA